MFVLLGVFCEFCEIFNNTYFVEEHLQTFTFDDEHFYSLRTRFYKVIHI